MSWQNALQQFYATIVVSHHISVYLPTLWQNQDSKYVVVMATTHFGPGSKSNDQIHTWKVFNGNDYASEMLILPYCARLIGGSKDNGICYCLDMCLTVTFECCWITKLVHQERPTLQYLLQFQNDEKGSLYFYSQQQVCNCIRYYPCRYKTNWWMVVQCFCIPMDKWICTSPIVNNGWFLNFPSSALLSKLSS